MANSVNTNFGAQIALQNLNATNSQLASTQNRISTGLKVASAKDNGSIWAIAQTQTAQASSLDAVTNSLNNGKSVLDTTLSAGSQLTDILTRMQSDALAASDTGIDDDSRQQYQDEFTSLAKSYANTIASATFNGKNLLDAGSGAVSALGSADGKVTVSAGHQDISASTVFTGVGALTLTAGTATGDGPASVDTVATGSTVWTGTGGAANAAADLAKIQTAMKTVTKAMSAIGVNSKSMDNQISLVGSLQDSLTAGVGNLVDADLAKESAKLQSLQTKQQLGIQALSIANSSTSSILSLFR